VGVVAEIWRHPIKSHGHERIDQVELIEGKCLPWDRRWAVAHEQSRFDVEQPKWEPCGEFSIGSKSPSLQAIQCKTNPTFRTLTLSHPERPDLTIDPDDPEDANRFVQWVTPLSNKERAFPARLVRAEPAMTDTDYQSVSLINLASHKTVETQIGQTLDPRRWRANFNIQGLEPWVEHDLIGKVIRIGTAEFEVRERIQRCNATMANPETGEKDANTLAALRDGFGHTDFGVYAVVTKSGLVQQDDVVKVL